MENDFRMLCIKIKEMISNRQYKECERIISKNMGTYPHSPVPHNLMGIVLESEKRHELAMNHFRAAYALDPSYTPAVYNMEQFGCYYPSGKCAYSKEDCEEGNQYLFSSKFENNLYHAANR